MSSPAYSIRKLWLGILLLLTLLAAFWPTSDDTEPAAKRSKAYSHAPRQMDVTEVHFTPLLSSPALSRNPISDMFPAQNWTPPPPKASAPAAPSAPPLPFSFAGRYTEGNTVTVFLTEGNQMYRVRLGDLLKNTYRVEKIEQASISFTYLPLGISQNLPTGVLKP